MGIYDNIIIMDNYNIDINRDIITIKDNLTNLKNIVKNKLLKIV